MNRTGLHLGVLLGCLLVEAVGALFMIPATTAHAWEDDQSADKDRRLKIMQQSVARIRVELGEQHGGAPAIAVRKEPIQRWSNPIGGGIPDAAVFLWTDRRRPVVVSQVAQTTDGHWFQEFQSLSTAPLVARDGETRFWAPAAAGIQWQDVPATARPASRTSLRLVQMRAIAQQFSVTDKFGTESPHQLRLLRQPLYRYADPSRGVLDGGLFSFAVATDPEVLLLVEAQAADQGHIWKTAFAPLTIFPCAASRDGELVWQCPPRPAPQDFSGAFMARGYEPPDPLEKQP